MGRCWGCGKVISKDKVYCSMKCKQKEGKRLGNKPIPFRSYTHKETAVWD